MTVNGDLNFDPADEFGIDPAGAERLTQRVLTEQPALTGATLTPEDVLMIARIAASCNAIVGPGQVLVVLRPRGFDAGMAWAAHMGGSIHLISARHAGLTVHPGASISEIVHALLTDAVEALNDALDEAYETIEKSEPDDHIDDDTCATADWLRAVALAVAREGVLDGDAADEVAAVLALAGMGADALEGWPALTQARAEDLTAEDFAAIVRRSHELRLLLLPVNTTVEVRTPLSPQSPFEGDLVVVDISTERAVAVPLHRLYAATTEAVAEDEATAASVQAAAVVALAAAISAGRELLDAEIDAAAVA